MATSQKKKKNTTTYNPTAYSLCNTRAVHPITFKLTAVPKLYNKSERSTACVRGRDRESQVKNDDDEDQKERENHTYIRTYIL